MKTKRILALTLVVLMLASMMNVSVFAEEWTLNGDLNLNGPATEGVSPDAEATAAFTIGGIMTTTADTLEEAIEAAEYFYTMIGNVSAIGNPVIRLNADYELTEPIVIDSEYPIIIDLNGYEMVYNSTTQGEAMITNKGDLTINDSVGTGVINYNYTGAADSTYSKGNYTISNGGTLTVNGGKITIANLSAHAKYPIDNNSTTGDAILVINGGHLYNYNTSAIRQFCNSTTYKNSVTINGGVVEGYSAIWMQNPGAKTVNGSLSITGGEIKTTAKAYVNGTSALKDVSSNIYCTIDGEGGAWSEDSTVSITGGIINENVDFAEEAPATITIGESVTFNGRVKTPDIEGLSGAGTEEDPFLINNLEELKWFRDDVNAGNNYSGKFVKLTADIDLNNEEWTPIGYKGATFIGNFDGGRKTISNLTITKTLTNSSDNNGIGFFGRTDSPATIANLTIENVDIIGSLYVGAIVGYGYTGKSITNCTVKGDITIDAWWYAGVIGGNGYMSLVDNCHVIGNDGSYIKGNDGSYIGGIWGFRGEGDNKITNCTVTNLDISGVDRVGGICGIGHYKNTISGCSVENVAIKATDADATTVGLIVGACQGNKSNPTTFTSNTVTEVTATVGETTITDLYGTNIDGTTPVTNYVAKIGSAVYETLEEAFKAATAGCTIEILSDVTIDYKWDCRDYVTGGSHSQFKESVTINGNNHTIKFTDTVNDGNWNTIFRFEENATVKNLKIDISEATGTQRVITAKKSLTVDQLTIIGSAKYGIIFGEGASAEDRADAEISITNSTLSGTRRAISDNEGGKDVKSVTVTGNTLNANTYLSAFESITFNNNTTTGEVDLRAYTPGNTLDVTATGNTLNTEVKNYIEAGGTVDAQEEFKLPAKPVAQIGETKYTSLQEAIDAAKSGDIIKLLSNITLTKTATIAADDNITLDLAGYTISQTKECTESYAMISNDGTLVIDDTSEGKTGKIVMTDTGAGDSTFGWGTYTIRNSGKLTVKNGTIELKAEINKDVVKHCAITIFNYDGETTINGGTITSSDYRSIRLWNGEVTVNGGTINGQVWVQNDSINNATSELTITGGSFSPRGADGSSVFVGHGATGSNTSLSITGGTFATKIGCTDSTNFTGLTGGITGGIFTESAAKNGATKALCEIVGYELVQADDGNYTVQPKAATYVAQIGETKYETLQAAIDEATGENNVVQLISNVELTEGIVVTKDDVIILDLNGYTVSRNTEATTSTAAITNNGTLTIKDSGENGKITAFASNPDTADVPYYANNTITNCGVLNIEDGTIENSTGDEARAAYPIDNNSTSNDAIVNITGGTVTGRGAIRQFANSTTKKNEVNISGGMVNGTSYGVWVQNPGSGDPVASLNISDDAVVAKVLISPSANFEPAISGGTVNTVAIWEADASNADRNPSKFITGGTFSDASVEAFLAEGYELNQNDDNTYGVVKEEEKAKINIAGSNMILGNSLAMNFFIKIADLGDNTDYYVTITKTYADGRADLVETIPYAEWTDQTIEGIAYKKITFNHIAAKEMSDDIYIQVFNNNGEPAGDVRTDSIRNYATRAFAQSSTTNKSKSMLVDMLNYGVAAQTGFNYNMSDLANSELSEELKAMATPDRALKDPEVTKASGTAAGSTLVLDNNITLSLWFRGSVSDVATAEISYTDHYGHEKKFTINSSEFQTRPGGYYTVNVETLVVADGYVPVTCVVKDANGTEVGRVVESFAGYLNRATNKTFNPLLNFVTSAYNYFHSNNEQ